MKTEELKQASERDLPHFDAHEFDGLRETWDEAAGVLSTVDQCIRQRPVTATLLALGLGVALGCWLARSE
jgi:hypothetical protein